MIYLICAKDNKQRIVELDDKDNFKENLFYKYIVESFEHKNILYPLEFYNGIIKQILPNRVNIIYTHESTKKLPNVVNGIVLNDYKEIVRSYKNDIDDVYIFATNKWIIEEFHKLADYIIVFVSDSIGYTMQFLPDYLNFSDYDLIRSENPTNKDFRIEYYVSNKKDR